MSLYKGNTPIAGLSERTKYNAHHLLDFKWTDCLMNDVSWLRADTFSWQDGSVYVSAYNAIVADLSGATQTTETISGTTITYYRATSGRKIVLADQETNVLTVYNATGYGWYYILDTTNTRFKLPRTKWGFTGLRDNVGNYVEAGLPNITGTFRPPVEMANSKDATGAFSYTSDSNQNSITSGWANKNVANFSFDASRSSSIYGNSSTVQPPAVQMYLYFYVGDFSQTAIEQTAGLNSSLFNDKADTDLNNVALTSSFATVLNTAGIRTVVETYVNGSSWYRVWSDGWCEQGGIYSGTADYYNVVLLKQYASSTYNISGVSDNNSGRAGSFTMIDGGSQTATGFTVICNFNGTAASNKVIRWQTAGYIS